MTKDHHYVSLISICNKAKSPSCSAGRYGESKKRDATKTQFVYDFNENRSSFLISYLSNNNVPASTMCDNACGLEFVICKS